MSCDGNNGTPPSPAIAPGMDLADPARAVEAYLRRTGGGAIDPRVVAVVSGFDAPFFQAGLAGYSDAAMRIIARRHGCPFCVTEALLGGWQVNGILTLLSGRPFTPQFSAPDIAQQRPDLVGDPYSNIPAGLLFNPGAFAEPVATAAAPDLYGDAGRNILIGCPSNVIDLSLARTIRLGGARELRFQVDAFNAFDIVSITARNTTANYQSPTNLTLLNSQYNADGSLNQARLLPRNAGFGAATNAGAMRNFQAMIRFSF